MNRQLKRQRCVHCSPEEQEMIRDRAKKAGKTVSGYLIDIALNDDPDIHPLVLSPNEQKEMLNGIRHLEDIGRALRRELPGTDGLNLFGVEAMMKWFR